jgi:hypothetical protein
MSANIRSLRDMNSDPEARPFMGRDASGPASN